MKLSMMVMVFSVSLAACGKGTDDKAGGSVAAAGAAPAAKAEQGGPACADAAAKYVALDVAGGMSELSRIKPTPDQVKEVTAQIAENCTAGARGAWTKATKECVANATSNFDTPKCWKDGMDHAYVAQVLFDYAAAHKPAAPTPPTP